MRQKANGFYTRETAADENDKGRLQPDGQDEQANDRLGYSDDLWCSTGGEAQGTLEASSGRA